jgi:hypothetical protein
MRARSQACFACFTLAQFVILALLGAAIATPWSLIYSEGHLETVKLHEVELVSLRSLKTCTFETATNGTSRDKFHCDDSVGFSRSDKDDTCFIDGQVNQSILGVAAILTLSALTIRFIAACCCDVSNKCLRVLFAACTLLSIIGCVSAMILWAEGCHTHVVRQVTASPAIHVPGISGLYTRGYFAP